MIFSRSTSVLLYSGILSVLSWKLPNSTIFYCFWRSRLTAFTVITLIVNWAFVCCLVGNASNKFQMCRALRLYAVTWTKVSRYCYGWSKRYQQTLISFYMYDVWVCCLFTDLPQELTGRGNCSSHANCFLLLRWNEINLLMDSVVVVWFCRKLVVNKAKGFCRLSCNPCRSIQILFTSLLSMCMSVCIPLLFLQFATGWARGTGVPAVSHFYKILVILASIPWYQYYFLMPNSVTKWTVY